MSRHGYLFCFIPSVSRFCLSETSCPQEDHFPPNLCVKVNGKPCNLPVRNSPSIKDSHIYLITLIIFTAWLYGRTAVRLLQGCFNVLWFLLPVFVTLQGYLPPTKNGVEPKRPSRPINITSLVRLSTTVPNTIVVSWTSEIGRVGFDLICVMPCVPGLWGKLKNPQHQTPTTILHIGS